MPVNIRIPEEIHDLLRNAIQEIKGEVKKGDIQDFITKIILISVDIYLPEDSKLRKKLNELKEKYNVKISDEDLQKLMGYTTKKINKMIEDYTKNIKEMAEALKEVRGLFETLKEITTKLKGE